MTGTILRPAPPRSVGSDLQSREQCARWNDLKTRHDDTVEVVVARDQRVCVAVPGELDQVVVASVGEYDPRRTDGIRKVDRFLLNSTAKLIDLVRGDAVTNRDAAVEECLTNFVHQFRAGDQLERPRAPEIEQSRRRSGAGKRPGDHAVGIDDDLHPPSGSGRWFRGRGCRPSIVDDTMGKDRSIILAETRLTSDPVDDPQSFAQRLFKNFGVPSAGPRCPHTDLTHQALIDRQSRLYPCHISILP